MTDTNRSPARYAFFALPVIVAVIAAWWFTRGPAPVPAAAGHDHAAMVASSGGGPVAISAADARRIGVTFATATHATLKREVQLAGEVVVDETRLRAVTLKVDGVVERLHADYVGKVIQRGEPLLALYSPMLVSAQEELLVATRLQATLARGASDAAGSAGDLAASARRRLLNWDVDPADIAAIEQHGMSHRTLTLRSPVSGTVIEKNVVGGQQVMAGQLLLRVADLTQVWVDGDVFEQDLPLVRIGQQVRVEFRALPDAPRTGRVVSFEPTLDQVTRTARVRVALPNAGGQLRPGMFATLHLVAAPQAATLVVPRSAVLSTGERSLVFVRREDGRLEPRQVAIGLSDDTQVQILRGLSHGDVVVASATFLVDAESNLGVAMGGMGDMPGMDMTAPKALERKTAPTTDTSAVDHSAHEMPATKPAGTKTPPSQDMPGMDHSMHDMPAAKPAAPAVRKPMQER
ncbi:MAG: efflux RND transporter periplasmic adaptor subunit [Gemmatimonadaceae bacterium]|nr:efflux RND transporter periplasmic adaptor subunit [Gemmatimonadaceae bacterium]